MTGTVVLASHSPRRSELLRQIGLEFTVVPADVDETMLPGEQPAEFALRIAREKALAVAGRTENAVVIAADTVVVVQGETLGKPKDARDAERMLNILSGKEHQVITGLVVYAAESGKSLSATSETTVRFRELRAGEIAAYVATGEPFDKAGAYGIQGRGALFVERLDGCYFNVVGLPLSLLGQLLTQQEIALW